MRRGELPKKPGGFLFGLGMIWIRMLCRKRGLVTGGSELLPDGAYYLYANHMSNSDFMYAYAAAYPKRPNAVATDYFFCTKITNWVMRTLGCIPTQQFVPDPGCIRSIGASIEAGRGILLFPEGTVSGRGFFDGVPAGAGKLVKRYPAPVFELRIRGDHMVRPKWAERARRGRVEAVIYPLLTRDDVMTKDAAELDSRITAALDHDEYAWAREGGHTYTGRGLMEGFTKLAYLCPKCGAMYTLVAEGDAIRCTACGNTAHIGADSCLHPDTEQDVTPKDPGAWIRFQMAAEKALIAEQGADYRIECPAYLKRMQGRDVRVGYRLAGDGAASLSLDGVRFNGVDLDGNDASFNYPLSRLYKLTYTKRGEMKLPIPGPGVAIQPHDVKITARWLSAWEVLKAAKK